MGAPTSAQDTWTLAGRTWRSRLIVGTGKYRDADETKACLAASGAEIVCEPAVTVMPAPAPLSLSARMLSPLDVRV